MRVIIGHSKDSGYKLQPVAYDPNPQIEEPDDPRQSWQEGDDLEPMLREPPSQPFPQPLKILHDQASENAQKGQIAPPQLPPLYFEPHSQIQQQDFAYQQQKQQSRHQNGFNQGDQALPSLQTVQAGPKDYPPAATAISQPSRSAPVSRPALINIRNGSGGSSRQTSSASLQSQLRSGQLSPLKPNVFGPSLQNDQVLASGSELPMRSQIDNVGTVAGKSHPSEETVGDSSNSFYWHSPQSSTDTTLDGSPKFAGHRDVDTSVSLTRKPEVTSPTNYGLSSASALGFGGPSDWEHFGDYNGEEIDDTDLYISNKHRTTELPATKTPVEELKVQPTAIMGNSSDGSNAASVEPIQHERQQQLTPATEQEQRTRCDSQEIDQTGAVPISPARESSPPHLDGSLEVPENDADNIESSLTKGDSVMMPSLAESKPDLNEMNDQLSSGGTHVENLTTSFDLNKQLTNEEAVTNTDSGNEKVDNDNGEKSEIREDQGEGLHDRDGNSIESEKDTKESDDDGRPNDDAVNQISLSQDGVRGTHSAKGRLILDSRVSQDDMSEDIIISLQLPDPVSEGQARSRQPKNRLADGPWTAPLVGNTRLDPSRQDSLDNSRPRLSVYPKHMELEDPYANLDPWAKASLNRYVKMLHEEAEAEVEEEKYQIFMNFITRETRLRVVLYDMDEDAEPPPTPPLTRHAPPKDPVSTVPLRPHIKSKALPALPPDARQRQPGKSKNTPFQLETSHPTNSPEVVSRAVPESSTAQQIDTIIPPESTDESHVDAVDSPNNDEDTRGDRPKVSRVITDDYPKSLKVTPSLTSLRQALDVVSGGAGTESRSDRVEESTETAGKAFNHLRQAENPRSSSVPPHSASSVEKEQPGRSGYTSFRYNEGRPYEGDKATNRQSIYRPFSTLLRQGSQRHGSMNSGIEILKDLTNQRRGTISGTSITSNEHSQLSILEAEWKLNLSAPNTEEPLAKVPAQRFSILQPLLGVIPPDSVVRPESEQLIQLRHEMEAIPDEFGFIHKTVVAWDTEAKQIRELHDKKRYARQGESEQRIDPLFHDNEIGYGDISELEAEFKRSEATIKAEEDRAEFQSFVSKVFDIVWAHLHYEMDRLTPLFDVCTRMVIESSAGRDMFEDGVERVPAAPAMETLLLLYQKLAIRHQKAFEAVLERDRRLKKTEVAPWYALGNISKVKKIEKRYEDAEKKAILEFCRQRDERANLLMDVLDQNTLRGVGSNQDYMESVMQATRKIAMEVALGGVEDDTDMSTDDILKAKTITTALARSSEQIVQTFHVADMLLNAADYEVSVANARLANADAAAFKRLRDAKSKEDQKLVKDLEHRMSLIRGDSSRTHDEITKLLSLLGSIPGDSTPPRSTSAPADPEREARLLVALEEAKRRNAPGGSGGSYYIS